MRQSHAMRAPAGALIVIALFACSKKAPPPKPRDYCQGPVAMQPAPPLGAQTGSAKRPVNTFSIVARDPATGDLGVAVQSHWFSVGSIVTWAEPGVGAIATQAFAEPAYGPRGLTLMRDGVPAPEALQQLTAVDLQQEVRQVGMIDAQGRVASHTGAKCIAFASSHVGNNYAVQANIMANDKVVPAMARAYETAAGDLTDKLMAALDAGQAAGGDLRGCQSAAILVVSGKRSDTPWKEKKIDLRVEDSPDPLRELRRLVVLARAYDQMNQGDAALEKKDIKAAGEHYTAAARMVPERAEILYWSAISLAAQGPYDRDSLTRVLKSDPRWIELTKRIVPAGILDQATADRILSEAR